MKSKVRITGFGIFGFLLLLSIIALAFSNAEASSPPKTIKIGGAVSFTGRFASGGLESKFGYEQAVADINKEGGVFVKEFNKQIPLELIIEVDQEDDLIFLFVACQQCEDAICSGVCPTSALKRDVSTGAMVINRDKCVGCRMCLMNCPFGAISFNLRKKQVFKCELCSGDPQCVKFCQSQALKFIPVEEAPLGKRVWTAAKALKGLLENGRSEKEGR